ncbi:MAG: SPFH domain-containing protein [Candidatus Nanopelagicales bacterium]|jgi:hypothetical protein|nr:SPFH domain-containing protein [Thermoanaerobaculales bacterium]MCU0302385.1 SPFH domain-containing protein [Candidatus Nanopelagicales bacterium]
MSTGARIVLAIIVLPILVTFAWSLFRQSVVTIPAGRIGLLVVRGRPTDKVLLPGPHWVPALRKRQSVEYPALEMSLRCTESPGQPTPAESYAPPLRVTLGDRAQAVVEVTVRFRIDPERLRLVHDRFGPEGIWAVVRDDAARAVAAELADPAVTIDQAFGTERVALERRLSEAVGAALDADGLLLTGFALGAIDLGRAGELIQAVVRARLELAKEEAEADTRLARVTHDAELAPHLARIGDTALRYRQTDVWRELASRPEGMTILGPGLAGAAAPADADQADSRTPGEAEGSPGGA